MKNQIKSNEDSRKKVYQFLVKYFKKNGYAPSIREICVGTNLNSTATVHYHLMELALKGKIEIKENCSRAIKLVGFKYTKKGNSMEETKESNWIKEETINNVIADLKKEIPLLSEQEIQRIRDAFYSGTENYLFKRKGE